VIVTVVTFRLPERWTRERALAVHRSTAPKYVAKSGLIRKHYALHEDGRRSSGIYLWADRASAEACFTPAWEQAVARRYGAPPTVEYLEATVTVECAAGTIVEERVR
jgi:hypothetical protein